MVYVVSGLYVIVGTYAHRLMRRIRRKHEATWDHPDWALTTVMAIFAAAWPLLAVFVAAWSVEKAAHR